MKKLDIIGEYLTHERGHAYVWSNSDNWIKPAEETEAPELTSNEVDEIYKDALVWNTWRTVRLERDALLKKTDWTQVPDAPVDQVKWALYRQALRDITKQSDPFNIEWPVAPDQGA